VIAGDGVGAGGAETLTSQNARVGLVAASGLRSAGKGETAGVRFIPGRRSADARGKREDGLAAP